MRRSDHCWLQEQWYSVLIRASRRISYIKPSILNPLATAWASMHVESELFVDNDAKIFLRGSPLQNHSIASCTLDDCFGIPRCMTLHLSMLNGSCQAADQLASA